MAEKNAQNSTSERPPIIVIMGHIDHGKSTLLDYIRKSNIVAGEAGGITQHISAYEVTHKGPNGEDKKITFLDTPGHESFSQMRERGAQIADIAILIVSAEEGVKAQTLEAYKSAQNSNIPVIVAANKIDRPNANLDRCRQELAEANILVEGWGGNIPFVPISAKTGEGVSDLLDMMLLVAEMQELKGTESAPAEGFILEAKLDPKSGVTSTFVVKDGTINTGDYVVVEGKVAKLKKIENFLGQEVKSATFSSPIRVFGFSEIPPVGSIFVSFTDKKEAEKAAERACLEAAKRSTNGGASYSATEGSVEIPLVVKADVCGTLEALEKEIGKLKTDKVTPRIIQYGVGAITESDVKLASSSKDSIILGFHVKVDKSAIDAAERFSIKIETFDIIYKLSEWLEELIKEKTPKEKIEETSGKARVLKIFNQNKDKQVLGAVVLSGKIARGKEVKILRKDIEVGRGKITDLQEQKIKVPQVEEGMQFGIEIDSKLTIAISDVIEQFDVVVK